MAPMSLSDSLHNELLRVALDSIEHGLAQGKALRVALSDYDTQLQEQCACFVTLNKHDQLRGCIGHLEPVQPLVKDVAENAFSAAFRDPRFPALKTEELFELDIHISILTLATPMTFSSEADLLGQIRPGIDGLILEDGMHRGTFLPSVWESLPDVDQFWSHLKQKAGLPQSHWSESLRVSRYQTESFGLKASEVG